MRAPRHIIRDAVAAATPQAPFLVLTGAGISAESGIPTFRGAEGFWRVGSRHYQPVELATWAAFSRAPRDAWGWYLYRRSLCRAAAPNAAHRALVALETRLGDRFLLVTQNVDGLHLRAGHAPARVYQIHGNIDLRRCARDCSTDLLPIPDALGETWAEGRAPDDATLALLACPRCGGPGRPHVLWFDESYDEPLFRFESTLRAARSCAGLLVIGTSGATNLPTMVCEIAAARRVPFVVVDPEPTVFSRLAESAGGAFVPGRATDVVPALMAAG